MKLPKNPNDTAKSTLSLPLVLSLALSPVLFALALGCSSTSTSPDKPETASADKSADKASSADLSLDGGKSANKTSSTTKPLASGDFAPLTAAIRGGHDEAIAAEAIKLLMKNPDDPVALNALAVCYFHKGKLGAAKQLLGKALEKNPPKAAVLNNLALIDLAEDDPALAQENFKKAIRVEDNSEVAANLGSIYLQGGDDVRALALLEQGYKANSNSAPLANNYAVALRRNKSYDAAKTVYDDLIKQNPRDVSILLNAAILYIDYMNKPKDGLSLVSKIKFLETERKDIIDRANTLEKKARSELK